MDLRILLVEDDERRAKRLQTRLESARHSIVPVANLADAAEALLIQKFEVVLIGSGQPADELSSFLTRLRTLEARQAVGSPVAVLACAAELTGSPALDGSLPEGFDAAQFSQVVSGIYRAPATLGTEAQTALYDLPVFEPERFKEQCANEAELMIEIVDLFAEECACEIPEMTEALESGDFERLSRLAHTLKGSLGSLHATAAWRQSQELESAAKAQNRTRCAQTLGALKRQLDELHAHLTRFRQACISR